MKYLTVLFTMFALLVQTGWTDQSDESADLKKAKLVKNAKKTDKGKRGKRKARSQEPGEAGRAAVKVEGPMTLAPFKPNVPVWGNTDRYNWTTIPSAFENFFFTQFDSNHQGVTKFEVRSPGRVYIAVTSRWGGGGNSSGGWVEELTSQEAFLEQGWKKVAKIEEERGDASHGHHWVIYERDCESGERFQLRTEKYCAPILLF